MILRAPAAALCLALGLVGGACVGDGFRPAPGYATATITLSPPGGGAVAVVVEVATTPGQRAQGLMFRRDLPAGRGMLFVYPAERAGGHWMKDTYIALDIAYVDSGGTVFEVVQGRPLDTAVLDASRPFLYVIEVPAGWMGANGLGVGTRLTLPAGLPAAR